ncbi:MAG: glycosyltransferase [Proteobacteria bacterium]|nr:glycosyltransferase [Pseudomonadota bacterium]
MKSISSLHIIGSRNSGGAERFFTRLVRALDERGLPTMVLARRGSAVSEELKGVVDQVNVPMANVRDPFSRFRISRFIGANSFDIVQTYMGRATRLTRIPEHSKSIHVSRLGGFYKLNGYRHADAWIGNTKALRDYLISNGFPASRVFYIPNFLEIPEKPPRETIEKTRLNLGIPEGSIALLGVGRLVKKKGFSVLLESFELLFESIPDNPLYLMIVGDGQEARTLREQIKKMKSGKRILFTGWKNDPDPFYASADLFVCPSLHEPLGNVILEAWSHRLPVVSTETDGARELIQDGISGHLVPCGDASALAEKIRDTLAQGSKAMMELADNGLRVLKRDFGKDAIVDSYVELYEKLLASRE